MNIRTLTTAASLLIISSSGLSTLWAEPCAEDVCLPLLQDLKTSCAELMQVTGSKPEVSTISIKQGDSSCQCSCNLAPLEAKIAAIEAEKKRVEDAKRKAQEEARQKELEAKAREQNKQKAMEALVEQFSGPFGVLTKSAKTKKPKSPPQPREPREKSRL